MRLLKDPDGAHKHLMGIKKIEIQSEIRNYYDTHRAMEIIGDPQFNYFI